MTGKPPAAITIIVRPPFGFRIAEAAEDFIAGFTDMTVTVETEPDGSIVIEAGVAIGPPTGAAARQHVISPGETYAAGHDLTINFVTGKHEQD